MFVVFCLQSVSVKCCTYFNLSKHISHSRALCFRILVNSRCSQVVNQEQQSQENFAYCGQSSMNKGMVSIPTQLLLFFSCCYKNSSHVHNLGRDAFLTLSVFTTWRSGWKYSYKEAGVEPDRILWKWLSSFLLFTQFRLTVPGMAPLNVLVAFLVLPS